MTWITGQIRNGDGGGEAVCSAPMCLRECGHPERNLICCSDSTQVQALPPRRRSRRQAIATCWERGVLRPRPTAPVKHHYLIAASVHR